MAVYDPVFNPSDEVSLRSLGRDDASHHAHRDRSQTPSAEPDKQPLRDVPAPLGKPTSKAIGSLFDLLVLLVTLSSLALAVATVADNRIAWNLGYTRQLVVVGFLLSVMNLCMAHVAPGFFLQLDARFGHLTLQNAEAILHSTPLVSKSGWRWRSILFFMIALPLGLSVAYKRFTGGSASMVITSDSSHLYNDTFGMFAPSGVLPLAYNTGLTLFINATIPFLAASQNVSNGYARDPLYGDPRFDPALPTYPKAYGFNTLLLGEDTSASLDAPPADWIAKVLPALGPGESWNVTGSVLGTVSRRNTSIDAHRAEDVNGSSFWQYYTGDEGLAIQTLHNGWEFGFSTNLKNIQGFDQSWCFLGFVPDPGDSQADAAVYFSQAATMFTTMRQNCTGTWSISAGAVELVAGSCSPSENISVANNPQDVYTNNILVLTEVFMDVLIEALAPFATYRNQSQWRMPTMSTVVASMYWSRVAAAYGPQSPHWLGNDSYHYGDPTSFAGLVPSAGLVYHSPSVIVSSRPSLRASPWLYFVLAVQPLITVGMMAARIWLYNVPIGEGFGMTAILAGIRTETLELLEGAGFSGELRRPVHLSVHVDRCDDGSSKVTYSLSAVEGKSGSIIQRRQLYR